MIRLFLSCPLSAGEAVAPSADQSRYLTTVMRLKPGEPLQLFNGVDGEWLARLTETSKRGCVLLVGERLRPQNEPATVELLMALVKRARLDSIIEKAVELGVGRVRLVITGRTNADHVNMARLRAIAVEAAEQTGRLDVPEILEPLRLDTVLASWPQTSKIMFCDEVGDDTRQAWAGRAPSALEALATARGSKSAWGVLIGPEGGFTLEERTRLRALPTVVSVSLGPRILRADTAALAALVLLQATTGDWREHETAFQQSEG